MNTYNYFTSKLKTKSNEQLIKLYYSHPISNLIYNALILVSFILGIALMPVGAIVSLVICLLIGAALIILCNINCPINASKIIREFIKNNKTEEQILQIYELESDFVKKKIVKVSNQKIVLKICVALHVINIIFKFITSLIILLFALILAVMVNVFVFLANLVFSAAGANGVAAMLTKLAKVSFLPVKWCIAFIKSDLTNFSFKFVNDFDNATTNNPIKMSQYESTFYIDKYISLNSYSLPGNYFWDGNPNLTISGNHIYVDGTVVLAKCINPNTINLGAVLNSISVEISEHLKKQANNYQKEYPNAPTVNIEVNLKGRFE